MRILVTGSTGFLGNAVASELSRTGHETIGLIRNLKDYDRLAREEIRCVQGTLSSIADYQSTVSSVDCIVHCAADHSVDSHALDSQFLDQLFKCFGDSKSLPVKLIFTSGSWVYGDRPGESLTEESILKPPSFVAGRVVNEQRVLERGGYVVRPPLLYGLSGSLTGMWFDAAQADGAVWIPGSGDNTVSMLHVLDAACFYRLLAESSVGPGIFNVASGISQSLRQCAEAVHKAVGCRAAVQLRPLEEARSELGVIADGLSFSQEVVARRATELVGWKPTHQSFVAGISRYHATWQVHSRSYQ